MRGVSEIAGLKFSRCFIKSTVKYKPVEISQTKFHYDNLRHSRPLPPFRYIHANLFEGNKISVFISVGRILPSDLLFRGS